MSPNLSRRHALRLGAASLALVAGCLADPGGTNPAATTEPGQTAGPTATTPTASGSTSSVQSLRWVPAVVGMNTPDSIATFGERDEQFLVVTVETDGSDELDRDQYSLVADDRTFEPNGLGEPGGTPWGLWVDGTIYRPSNAGVLGFTLPKPLDVDEAAVQGPGGRYDLGGSVRQRLARPPTDFRVLEYSAPDAVQAGEDVPVTLRVRNVGEHHGTFVGALNRVGPNVAYAPVRAIHLDLAPGAATTWNYTLSAPRAATSGSGAVQFRFNWRGGRQSTTTEFETPDE